MIAHDCQAFYIVDDEGFGKLVKALEPRYPLSEKIVPEIHSRVMCEVKESLAEVKWLSFTSDIWSTEVSNESLISLTAHWVTPLFEKKSAMLNASSLPGSHTGNAIRLKYEELFGIEQRKLRGFVADNAANMKNAMEYGGYS